MTFNEFIYWKREEEQYSQSIHYAYLQKLYSEEKPYKTDFDRYIDKMKTKNPEGK